MRTDARPGQQSSPRGPGDRSLFCPECGLVLPLRQHREHLLAVHGYLEVGGLPQPRPLALAYLWERVFTAADTTAHDRLCGILLPPLPPRDPASAPYVGALAAEIRRRADQLFTADRGPLDQVITCLRQNLAARLLFRQLLAADNPHVREVGRELLLPEAGQDLARESVSVKEVQGWLDDLCPQEDVWEKIRLCRRLPSFGVGEEVVRECLRQLRAERPVACPECREPIPQEELDVHLRQVHYLYAFEGIRRPFQETRAAVLAALCSRSLEPGAWPALETLARDRSGPQAEVTLAAWLREALESRQEEARTASLPSVAQAISRSPHSLALVRLLAAAPEPAAQHLALILATHVHAPVDPAVVSALCPLLAGKRLPSQARIAAAATLLDAVGKQGPMATDIVTALSSNSGKARAVERLRALEGRLGRLVVLEARIASLEQQMRLRCPRCQLQLQRPDMVRHLWLQHQLVLAGRRVREPWRLVEDWIEEYRRDQDAQLLARCRAFAVHLDPEDGLRRVARLFLANQIDDAGALQELLREAVRHTATLCPHCYALVSVPQEIVPRPLNRSHGRLSCPGYRVEVTESGVVPRLTLETPRGGVSQGREPGRWLTRRGATSLLSGPPVLLALAMAVFLRAEAVPALLPVTLMLLLALALFVTVQGRWRRQPAAGDRAVDHAWSRLVPGLHAAGLSWEDSSFVASLALTSRQQGHVGPRAAVLRQVLEATELAVAAGSRPVSHLAALRRLALEDAATSAQDLVPLVVEQLGRCLEGKLPLVFAERLLTDWDSPWWTRGNRARLRVLLCDRAFEVGREVQDVIELGRLSPPLANILQTLYPDGLAQLRLLWSLRPSRPWDHCGPARTVFELAEDADLGRRLLASQENLLLADLAAPAILLTGQGLIFQDIRFAELPQTLEVKEQRGPQGTSYELLVDEQSFAFAEDPTAVRDRLNRWFGYHFGQFVPAVAGVLAWQVPGAVRPLLLEEQVQCPECQGLLLPRAGAVGTAVGAASSWRMSAPTDEGEVSEEDFV